MTMPPTPTVYQSRSRTTRKRVIVAVGVLALVLVGFLIGRLQGGGSATAGPAASHSAVPSSAAPPPPSSAPSPAPTTPPVGVDAYSPIQAESAAALNGVGTEDTSDDGGGQNVGRVNQGDSIRFDTVNFGDTPATSFEARVASQVGDGVNGRVEIRIDSADSPPVGTLPITDTGGWQNWITQATDITGVAGVHTVFLTFAADRGDDLLNLNYVKFGRASS
jgi:hypothetical protein